MVSFSRRTHWNLIPNEYSRALEEHRRSGRELLDLTASNPTTVGLNYNADALLHALAQPQSLVYEPTAKGLLAAREAVAGYYAQRGVSVSPEDLILTTSTSEAYSFVFRLLCNANESVLVPTPSYPLFDYLAELQDVVLLPYQLIYDHGWQIDFHSIAAAKSGMRRSGPFTPVAPEMLRAPGRIIVEEAGPNCKAVLVVHPNNPTGSFIKDGEAERLAEFCARNGLALISDEVFLDYSLGGSESGHSLLDNSSPALSFVLSGLSKISGLPQMKLAWVVVAGPPELKRQALERLEVIADTYLSVNAPVQWATPAMLEERKSIQPQLMRRIRANLAALDRELAGQSLCTRLTVEGGWYAVLRVPAVQSDEELVIELLRRRDVLVQPGHFYDFANDGYLVLSLITPEEQFTAGIRQLLSYVAGR